MCELKQFSATLLHYPDELVMNKRLLNCHFQYLIWGIVLLSAIGCQSLPQEEINERLSASDTLISLLHKQTDTLPATRAGEVVRAKVQVFFDSRGIASEPDVRADLLNRMIVGLIIKQDIAMIKSLMPLSVLWSQRNKDTWIRFDAYSNAVNYYLFMQQHDSVRHYLEAMQQTEEPLSPLRQAVLSTARGRYFAGQDMPQQALEDLKNAAAGFEEMGDTARMLQVLTILVSVNIDLGNMNEAWQNLNTIINQYDAENSVTGRLHVLINLSIVLKNLDSIPQAEQHIKEARLLAVQHQLNGFLPQIDLNAANIAFVAGDTLRSLDLYNRSLALSRAGKIVPGMIINYLDLAEKYLLMSRLESASAYLDSADQLLMRNNNLHHYLAYLELRARVADKRGDLQAYGRAMKAWKTKTDSADVEIKRNQSQQIQFRYRMDASRAKFEVAQDKYHLTISYIVAGVFCLAMLTIIYLIINRKRKKRLVESLKARDQVLAEKALRASRRNEELQKIAGELHKLIPYQEKSHAEQLQEQIKQLEIQLPGESWAEFEDSFLSVYVGFKDKLLARFPELTPTELKVCELLRLNLSSKEIADMTSRTKGRVDNIRSSIRKKMDLDSDTNLITFLMKV